MPGIIITPGDFNPPVVPTQLVAGYPFPKTALKTIRKWRQFSPRWVGEPPEPPSVPLPVIYSYFDFTTGAITVGVDVATFDAGQPNFTTAGVRYVADALYVKTAQNISGKTYSAVDSTPPYAAGGDSIALGLVEAEYGGDFEMPSTGIRVLVDFSLTVTGTGDGATYTLSTLDETDPGATSGTIVLGIAYPVNPASNGYINQTLDTEKVVIVTLRRNGVPFDKIYLLIPITGEVSFTLIPGTPGGDLDIPEVNTGLTWSDTLHGATASSPAGIMPGIPFSGYVRESWASEGEVTLS